MIIQSQTFNKKQFLGIGIIFHLLAAFYSYGAHHTDELFQVFEFAGYKLGLNQASELPWEFHEKMRSGIEPLFVFMFTKAFHFISIIDPFLIAFFLRTTVSLFSFYAVFLMLDFFEKEILQQHLKNNLWFLGSLFWCLPYFHARLSSENFATTLFIFGWIITLKNLRSPNTSLKLVFAGFLMGLAFLCRFQIAFMIAGFLGWLIIIERLDFKKIGLLVLGLLLALGVGVIIDYWLYNEWIFSSWNYLDLNLFQQAASQFGKQPFYFFISETLVQLLPPYSLIIVTLICVFWYRFKSHVLTWISLPFILLHFFSAHKELRFLFPILDFLPLMLVFSYSYLQSANGKFYRLLTNKVVTRVFVSLNLVALLSFTFLPADNVTQILKAIYNLTENQKAVLIYQDKNPYNNSGSLNYFKNKQVTTVKLDQLSDSLAGVEPMYYFTEEFVVRDIITIKNVTFRKVYAKFPWWFAYFNYNNWLERASFSIYKKY